MAQSAAGLLAAGPEARALRRVITLNHEIDHQLQRIAHAAHADHGAHAVPDVAADHVRWQPDEPLRAGMRRMAAAVEALRRELRPGDVVLVKGSRYRTWEVADALRAEAVQPGNGV